MIPDLFTVRDRAARNRVYRLLKSSMAWDGIDALAPTHIGSEAAPQSRERVPHSAVNNQPMLCANHLAFIGDSLSARMSISTASTLCVQAAVSLHRSANLSYCYDYDRPRPSGSVASNVAGRIVSQGACYADNVTPATPLRHRYDRRGQSYRWTAVFSCRPPSPPFSSF